MSLITASSITKSYGSLNVLRGINLSIAKSEIVSIVGASGAGKTTLLTILGTLDRADGGQLIIDGQDIAQLNGRQLSAFRNKRIGFVSTPIHGNDRLQQRRTGYHAALTELGIKNHADMEVEVPITAQGGAEALVKLTSRHRDIDAIFFSSDTLAVGAVQECHRRRWAVPGRIAIAGYGDMDLAAQLYPPLTTVKVNRYEMGRRAVRQLLARLGGDTKVPTITSLGFEIVDRDSA